MMVTTILFTFVTPNLSHTFYSHCTGKVAVIHQVYPETEEYRCHYPAATLTCTFPGGPFVAGWYVFIDGIQQNCDGYSNHLVDATNMTSGVLVLQMNNTRQQGLENNIYSCTAVYSDGSSADSGTVTLPPFEGQLLWHNMVPAVICS